MAGSKDPDLSFYRIKLRAWDGRLKGGRSPELELAAVCEGAKREVLIAGERMLASAAEDLRSKDKTSRSKASSVLQLAAFDRSCRNRISNGNFSVLASDKTARYILAALSRLCV